MSLDTDDIVIGGPPPEHSPLAEPPEATAVAAASGSGLAARLQAGVRRLEADRTREFPIPGWDGDLVVRARKLDESTIDKADTSLKTIALATDAVLLREHEDGPFTELSWRGIGDQMGTPADVAVSQIIAAVFDRNGAAIRVFCAEMLAWMAGRQAAIDQLLGE